MLRVGVGSPLPAKGLDDVDEPPVVLDAPLGTASLLLLLLLGLHLGGLAADLAGTGKGTVDLKLNKYIVHSFSYKLSCKNSVKVRSSLRISLELTCDAATKNCKGMVQWKGTKDFITYATLKSLKSF